MTDVLKMLTADEVAQLKKEVRSGEYSEADIEGLFAMADNALFLLNHIATLDARIAALEKAGDAMVRGKFDGYGTLCAHCGWYTPTTTPPKHATDCPVPAWLSIRNAI